MDAAASVLIADRGAGVAVGQNRLMLAYLAIFGAALAGFIGIGPWTIAAAAIALASLSRAQHGDLYDRSRELGLSRAIDSLMLRSLGNALVAAGAAYGFGWLMRII